MIEDKIRSLVEDIKEAEGFSPVRYKCSRGVISIGHGIALTRGLYDYEKEKLGINSIMELHTIDKETSEYLLKNTLYEIVLRLEKEEWITKVPPEKILIIIELCYNLGYDRFIKKFPNTVQAIKDNRWNDTMIELLDSKYLSDVKGRAIKNALSFVGVDLELPKARKLYSILKKRL